jgi:hypothetical protein
MRLTFGKQWFIADKHLTEVWDESRARMAYTNRHLHTAVVGAPERPLAFIEFNGDYVGVGFLDRLLREYLSYSFQEVEPGRLFLTMATHREFDGDSDRVQKGTTYIFNPDGDVTVISEEFPNGGKSRHKITADVSGNWESYPEFGKYDSLLREDR